MTPLTSGLHEECGVFGVFAKEKTNVAATTYYGLFALQHRGQESCGIVVNDDRVFMCVTARPEQMHVLMPSLFW